MDYTENLFLEFTRNITTSENFQNYPKEDVKTIYKKASLLKDNEYFKRKNFNGRFTRQKGGSPCVLCPSEIFRRPVYRSVEERILWKRYKTYR